jgi:4-amino-4-deoxy-L-arabinose transferase-like glycosyltransferase
MDLKFLSCLTEEEHPPGKPGLFLAFLVVLALGLRFSLYGYHHIIEGDGVHYAALARLISHDGNFLGAANEYWSNLWPVVIALFDLVIHNIELAGRLASTLFGALTILPVFFIAREFLNTRTSLVAAFLVVPQPYLLRFSVLLYTESFYTFLFALTLWLGIRLIKSPEKRDRWLLLGLVIGLGLWTRPEILAPGLVFLLVAIARSFSGRISAKRIAAGFLVFSGTVLFFLASRAVLVHHFQGKWHFGFGEKAGINIREGLLFYDFGTHETYLNRFENGRFVNLQRPREGLVSFLWKNRAEVLSRIKDNAERVIQSESTVLGPTKGMPLHRKLGTVLIFLGLLATWLARATRRWALLLAAIAAVYSAPWLLIFVADRFVVPLAVISVVFTAAGLIVLERAIAALFRRRRFTAWPVLPLLFVTAFIMRTASWARHDRDFIWERDPIVQKDAGVFLKEHFPQTTKILTWGPHIPYYFYEGNPYTFSVPNIPWAPYEEVIDYVRKQKIDLLVLPEWMLLTSDFPIKSLASKGARPDGLEFIAVIGKDMPERVWIYKVL